MRPQYEINDNGAFIIFQNLAIEAWPTFIAKSDISGIIYTEAGLFKIELISRPSFYFRFSDVVSPVMGIPVELMVLLWTWIDLCGCHSSSGGGGLPG
ncbi:MAG TPA: hypothetical protein VJ552_05825 [Sediminibacterium sp.]|nr:hypothetical protein [Sediminibacterium sp.]